MAKDVKPDPDETIAAGASAGGKPGSAKGQDERKMLGRDGNEPPKGEESMPKGKAD